MKTITVYRNYSSIGYKTSYSLYPDRMSDIDPDVLTCKLPDDFIIEKLPDGSDAIYWYNDIWPAEVGGHGSTPKIFYTKNGKAEEMELEVILNTK